MKTSNHSACGCAPKSELARASAEPKKGGCGPSCACDVCPCGDSCGCGDACPCAAKAD